MHTRSLENQAVNKPLEPHPKYDPENEDERLASEVQRAHDHQKNRLAWSLAFSRPQLNLPLLQGGGWGTQLLQVREKQYALFTQLHWKAYIKKYIA